MTANSEKWVNTLPKPKTNESVKKFSVLLTFFILGLIFVSIVKNETRKLRIKYFCILSMRLSPLPLKF